VPPVIRVVSCCLVAGVSTFQAAATVGGMSYQVGRPDDPCFITSLGVMRGMAAEVARFGRDAKSTRAVVEHRYAEMLAGFDDADSFAG